MGLLASPVKRNFNQKYIEKEIKPNDLQLFTKEQLVKAMTVYNQQAIDNPELFSDEKTDALLTPAEKAKKQITYLINLL